MSSAAYQQVQGVSGLGSPDDDDDGHENDHDDTFDDEYNSNALGRTIEPLELGSTYSGGDDDVIHDNERRARRAAATEEAMVWSRLALATTCWVVVPTLIAGIVMGYCMIGRIWTCILFALHLTLALIKARCHVSELATLSLSLQNNRNKNNPGRILDKINTQPTAVNTPYSDEDDDEAPHTGSDKNTETDAEEPAAISSWEPSDNSSRMDDYDDDDDDMPSAHAQYQSQGPVYFWLTSLPSLMDILLFGGLYPVIVTAFNGFFIDSDGTLIVEWTYYYQGFKWASIVGWAVVMLRLGVGGRMLLVSRVPSSTYYLTTSYYTIRQLPLLGACLHFCHSRIWLHCIRARLTSPIKCALCAQTIILISSIASAVFLGWTIISLVIHFGPFEPDQPHHDPTICDPIDMTECVLPFPSSYHLKEDASTATGYRVDLIPERFPMLKGRIPIKSDFLNQLDGFSTMGPVLFYIDGMKESHEQYMQALQNDPSLNLQPGITRLRGHEEIGLSITPLSTTLLVDVTAKELVPHSAEIDYLDPDRPLVLVFPGQPLKHNTHYALAVVNATDFDGIRLLPSPGMLDILDEGDPNDPSSRTHLFKKVLLPALEGATHKASANDQESGRSNGWGGPYGSFVRSRDKPALQLLFDFHTISKESQLGPVRQARDMTLKHVTEAWSSEWDDHVRVIRQIDMDCKNQWYPVARVIHGELDVPWFMTGFGPGFRDATLDLQSGAPNTVGKAKFVVRIPCSLKQAVAPMPKTNVTAQNLRAVMEFGHGLFYNRAESGDKFLVDMANKNGYIIIAMDWRGMSQYDFPLVARTMLTDPSLFGSIRDNLIQGYANKYALQHFVSNGLLEMPWMKFSKSGSGSGSNYLQPIPLYNSTAGVPSMFYGISQGGILGAGYVALSGPTKLISRGVLGVPGTPFSLILSRSLQFLGYDIALLLNFYDNRDVRLFLSLAQMCWDSVEGAGVLGQPVEEPVPRIIMQSGLGDPIVPSLAAERLARALGAEILPHAPRQPIFGIPVGNPSINQKAVLTEILYQTESDSLPVDDELTAPDNDVHNCVRLEPVLQNQIEEFFNSGEILDPCAAANGTACRRRKARCFGK